MTFQPNGWGGPVMSFATLVANHGSELVEMISIQTNSGWNGFDGYVDVAPANDPTARIACKDLP